MEHSNGTFEVTVTEDRLVISCDKKGWKEVDTLLLRFMFDDAVRCDKNFAEYLARGLELLSLERCNGNSQEHSIILETLQEEVEGLHRQP